MNGTGTERVREFAIATPWDDRFLRGLDALNAARPQARFAEVFGSHRTSITGGGRPAFRLPEVTEGRFAEHVRLAHALGLRFNYVMNAPEVPQLESDPVWRRRLLAFLEELAGHGVGKLTIASPPLLRLVREEFPAFSLTLSLIAGVDTVEAARRYEDLGVDVINLNPFTINRDFEAIGAIRAAVRCRLEVYANIACLGGCPWREAHYRHSGGSSRTGGDTGIGQDPFLRNCSSAFLADPAELLRSPFIRPEDVRAYWDAGIDVVKLADRTETAETLLRTARAYADEAYAGNLFALIFRGGRKFRAAVAASCPEARHADVPIVIDNQALDRLGFIDNVRRLRGGELEAFYRRAAAEALTLGDPDAIEAWRRWLQPQGIPEPPAQPRD